MTRRWTPAPGTLDERVVTGERPRSKYHAKRATVDGVTFASQKEAHRYGELKLLQRVGLIHLLTMQPKFPLVVKPGKALAGEVRIGEYRADFLYCECSRGDKCERTRLIVEDVKGFKTPLYKWKKKHVEAQYGILVREL